MPSSPVQLIGANSLEFIEFRPKNAEAQVVSHVNPDKNKEAEIRADYRMIKVVQGLGCLMGNRSVNWRDVIRGRMLLTARKKSLISCVI